MISYVLKDVKSSRILDTVFNNDSLEEVTKSVVFFVIMLMASFFTFTTPLVIAFMVSFFTFNTPSVISLIALFLIVSVPFVMSLMVLSLNEIISFLPAATVS